MSFLLRHAAWLAPLITLVGFISYFMVFAKFPALRDFPWVNLPLVLLGTGLAVAGLLRMWKENTSLKRVFHVLGTLVSVAIAGLLVGYVFFISYQMPGGEVAQEKLAVGKPAPDFSLKAASGELVSLGDFQGKKVVLSFYRGFW